MIEISMIQELLTRHIERVEKDLKDASSDLELAIVQMQQYQNNVNMCQTSLAKCIKDLEEYKAYTAYKSTK